MLRLNNNTTIELVDTLTDIKGGFHESYKEYYKGIEVEGTRFTIHYDRSGNAVTANGNFRTIENLDAEPIVSEEDALSNVIQYIGAEKYAWQENIVSYIKQDEDEMIESFYPKGQLVFFINQDNVYLAYKFYVECLVPQRSLCVYADALTGSVLSVRSSACEATASVTTRYSGVRSIETQYYNSNYRLRDYTRGNGIVTYKYNSSFNDSDYVSPNNNWSNLTGNDRNALDVHWGVEATYDFYYNKFGRNSYDNQGSIIKSFVNWNYTNSQWYESQSIMRFGFYDSSHPMVSLDVTAHEFTHGVTIETSDLVYQGESGAINEGLSDVFATCIEYEKKPEGGNNIWLCGEDFTSTPRNMVNPTCKYYQGTGWINPTSSYDNGGVHTNSGVFSYWFYLLAHGGNGTNQAGYNYSISGIGLDDAIQICYLMNCAYLTSNSNFADARRCSELATLALGYSAETLFMVSNAWYAVGVGSAPSLLNISGSSVLCDSHTYYVSGLPATGASVSWSLISGNMSCVSLQSNSPSTNQCTLTLTNPSGFNTVTLQADVIMNGVTVKSLQKVISKAVPFSGTYEETSILYNGSFTPSIPLTAIPGSREMDVYVGGLVKVKSDYFSGKSISISGPYTNYYRSGSLVRFTLSIPELRSPTRSLSWSGAPVVITVQAEGCDDEVRLKFFPAIMLDDYSLNITPDGNSTYDLSLIRKKEEGVLPETSSAADDCAAPRLFSKPWTLEVTNALTGRKTFSKEMDEPTFLLHTDGWAPGVYVVRALVGDASLAGKITVK